MSENLRRGFVGGLVLTAVMFFVFLQSLTLVQAVLTVLIPALAGLTIVLLIGRSIERSRTQR